MAVVEDVLCSLEAEVVPLTTRENASLSSEKQFHKNSDKKL